MASGLLTELISIFESKIDNVLSSKYQLLIVGFCRNFENKIDKDIPIEIVMTINYYYPNIFVYGIGKNQYGELGVGDNKRISQFRELQEMSRLCDFADTVFGNINRFIIFKQSSSEINEIYTCGDNYDGEGMSRLITDFNEEKDRIQFGKMEGINDDNNIILISGGFAANDALCMTHKGNIYGFGPNSHSDGTGFKAFSIWKNSDISKMGMLSKIKSINIGSDHIMYLMDDGSVYGYSSFNFYGQIGIKGGDDFYMDGPQRINSLNNYNIIQIECGSAHTICLDNNHNVIVFGRNKIAQLGLGHNKDVNDEIIINNYFINKSIIKIKSGWDHSICIDNNGNGYIFGDNKFGQIGNGKNGNDLFTKYPYLLQIKNIIIASVSNGHSIILTMNNNVYTFGNNSFFQCSSCINDTFINIPYLLSKQEIGTTQNDKIVNVIAGNSISVILVNKC